MGLTVAASILPVSSTNIFHICLSHLFFNLNFSDFELHSTATPDEVLSNWTKVITTASTLDTGFIVLEHDIWEQSVEIATGYILPDAIAKGLTIQPVAICIDGSMEDAYVGLQSNSTTPSPSGPPSNVASGTIIAGCTQYYTVVSGDSCFTVETQFSLTFAQFVAMNPEIDSQCTNLDLGEAYCVASSNSTSTGSSSNVTLSTKSL
jgi:hypothetical protein